MSDIQVLKTGIFQNEDEVTSLNLFDVHRSKASPSKTIHGISRWLIGRARYTISQVDMKQSPTRDDFPGWRHIGGHIEMGELYWNWFHDHFSHIPEKELLFSDSPDMWGSITFPEEDGLSQHKIHFWGDIGMVSASAFIESIIQMQKGDLLITICSEKRQIIVEALVDFFEPSPQADQPIPAYDISIEFQNSNTATVTMTDASGKVYRGTISREED